MTREEAIKILKEERWYMSRYSEEYKEAYDMAIEALSAEQTEYKLPGHDEVMEALGNMKLEFTINGTERVKRMAGDDHE